MRRLKMCGKRVTAAVYRLDVKSELLMLQQASLFGELNTLEQNHFSIKLNKP